MKPPPCNFVSIDVSYLLISVLNSFTCESNSAFVIKAEPSLSPKIAPKLSILVSTTKNSASNFFTIFCTFIHLFRSSNTSLFTSIIVLHKGCPFYLNNKPRPFYFLLLQETTTNYFLLHPLTIASNNRAIWSDTIYKKCAS